MSPFKRPQKPDEQEAAKDRSRDGKDAPRSAAKREPKPSQGAEGRRRDGQRKLQAALDRVDEPRDPGKDEARGKRAAGKSRRAERERPRDGSKTSPGRTRERVDPEPRRSGSKARKRKRRSRGDAPSLKQRARAGARRARVGAVRLLVALATVLAAGAALLFAGLGRLLALVLRVWLVARPPARAIANRGRRAVNAASRLVTPKRILVLVVAGAAILLALSQWVDYRSVSIGADAYTGLEAIAPPPEVERAEAGSPHAYVFVPIGALCLGLLVLALRGRPTAARLIAVAGAGAVLVALIVDRAAGLDVTEASMSFEGVEAKLIGGFYAQIASGLVLTASSLLLFGVLRAEAPTRSPRTEARSAQERTSRDRRRVRSAEA